MESLEGYLSRRSAHRNALARRVGESHTAREILQQPWTWRHTAAQLYREAEKLDASIVTILLHGAGTSDYVGRSVSDALRAHKGRLALAIPTTDFTLRPRDLFPPQGKASMVHFARSGNSPESAETLRIGLEVFADRASHWIVTCNADGELAAIARKHPDRCSLTVLHPATNDRGLAMTSSYSNMVIAGLWLSLPTLLPTVAELLAQAVERLFDAQSDALFDIAGRGFERGFYLGDGALHAAALESSLKMQELTRGEVITKPDSYLGFRHGPISALTERSLVVAYLSSNPHIRRYENDLIRQLRTGTLVLVGEGISDDLRERAALCLDHPELAEIPETHKAPFAVAVGQLLAAFCAASRGIDVDNPAGKDGSYSRVVQGVTIYPYAER